MLPRWWQLTSQGSGESREGACVSSHLAQFGPYNLVTFICSCDLFVNWFLMEEDWWNYVGLFFFHFEFRCGSFLQLKALSTPDQSATRTEHARPCVRLPWVPPLGCTDGRLEVSCKRNFFNFYMTSRFLPWRHLREVEVTPGWLTSNTFSQHDSRPGINEQKHHGFKTELEFAVTDPSQSPEHQEHHISACSPQAQC